MERGDGVLSRTLSNLAAIEAALIAGRVDCVGESTCRVGETAFRVGDTGASGAVVPPRVFSHDGGFCVGLFAPVGRRFACDGVVGVSLGLRGDVFGVVGRRAAGEPSLMEPGLRKGD